MLSFLDRESGFKDIADRRLNLDEFLGGKGGGGPSSERGLVGCLPFVGFAATLFMYFCLMNRSIAESASSASTGTGGRLFSGL